MPTSLGPAEILVILIVALVVLGPKRLPEAGRQIGRFVSEVRHWSSTVQAEIREVIDLEGEPSPPPPATAPPAPGPLAQPTPADLAPPAAPVPTRSPPATGGQSAAAEWGLPERAPAPPPPAQPAGGGAIPPEWATPPSANGDS
jgi:sec-independent protein translocase protein TatA